MENLTNSFASSTKTECGGFRTHKDTYNQIILDYMTRITMIKDANIKLKTV